MLSSIRRRAHPQLGELFPYVHSNWLESIHRSNLLPKEVIPMSWPITITTPSQSFRILSLATLFPLLLSCSPEPEPKALETSDSMAAAEPLAEQTNPSLEGEWGSFAADNGQSKYTSLDQIDASNVSEL